MNRDTRAYVIGQLEELGLTVTDTWGTNVTAGIPLHDPSDAFPYLIRKHPMQSFLFLGMITNEAIILFPGGYEAIPQHLLVEWAIAGILRSHRPKKPAITLCDDSEF